MSDRDVQKVVEEIVRKKTLQKGSCSRSEIERIVDNIDGVSFKSDNHLSGIIIHDSLVKYETDDSSREREGGKTRIKSIWFNKDEEDITEQIVDLDSFFPNQKNLSEYPNEAISGLLEQYRLFRNTNWSNSENWKYGFFNEGLDSEYDLENLNAEDIREIVTEFSERRSGVVVPAYMIGGQAGSEVWNAFKQRVEENPDKVAKDLSHLFDLSDSLDARLNRFEDKFSYILDETRASGGSLLGLATFLLMAAYPNRYIFYKQSLFSDFFEEFNGPDFNQRAGFDVEQYENVLSYSKQLKRDLSKKIENTSMVDVQDTFYFYQNYWLPDGLKTELDSIKNNGGSAYTRLFALKCFFEEQEDGSISEEEFDKVVKEKAEEEDLPGENKSSYIQLNYNVFRNYEPFTASDDKYGVKEEYHEYLDAMEHYVNYLWDEVSSETNYFVISHNKNPEELEEGYLRASYTEKDGDSRYKPERDLNMLNRGDTILHYKSKKFVGYSKAESEPEVIDTDDGEEFYLEVEINRFDNPRHLEDVADVLEEESDKVDKYYALASNRTKSEGYLRRLTERGAKHIINFQKTENYFWVTADPSIWKVSELDEGDQKFYPAYLPSGNKARIFSNFEKASEGDKVVFYQSTPVKKVVAEGIVSEGLHEEEVEGYDSTVEGITVEYRREIEGDVSWSKLKEIPDLEDSKPIINTAQGSIFKLEQEEFETILSLENPETTEEKLAEYTQTPEFNIKVPEDLYFENESDLRNEISASLNSGKNIIFTGPPGTGKTKLAKSISKQVSRDEERVEGSVFTTATADWTAFDTIGGYMPSQGNGDELEFNPGQFLKCFREESGEVTNKWLVIDEINRSDIDKAFGQLFSVLSGDSVELPYKKDGHVKLEKVDEDDDTEEIERNEDIYPVTDSWRLIATMNTYDKTSLYDMSYAFMRRFNFIHVGVPDLKTGEEYNFSLLNPEVDENYASVWDAEEVLEKDEFYKDLIVLWHEVNRQRDIGPSIIKDIIDFVDSHPGDTETALAQAVNSLILPQFEGLRREKQENFIKALNGEKSIGIKSELVEEKAENMFNLELSE